MQGNVDELAASLLSRTEARRRATADLLEAGRQRALGQFFTPRVVADRVAAEIRLPSDGGLRLLDPGAGCGSLTAAVVARLIRERSSLDIDVTAVEVDPDLRLPLRKTLDDCRRTAKSGGIRLRYSIIEGDFIEWAASALGATVMAQPTVPLFDLVIQNPPYQEISASSPIRSTVRQLGVDVPNLYAAFLALGVCLLREEGQLAAITPRSFGNGTYFRTFRKWFFEVMGVDRLCVFQERSSLFADHSVLQENIVLTGTRGRRPEKVAIATSRSYDDPIHERLVRYEDVIWPGDPEAFLHVPTDVEDGFAASIVGGLSTTLGDLDISVSTGKVVDFRAKHALRKMPESGTVPLIYPQHLRNGRLTWPILNLKKPNAIVKDSSTASLLFPAGTYVVVKRFSAKEDKKRVKAFIVLPSDVESDHIGFENHLNVFHSHNMGLDPDLAKGLVFWLNSEILENLFRQFSGHTQVNAGDLRNLRYPSRSELRRLGKSIRPGSWPTAEESDAIVWEFVRSEAGLRSAGSHVEEVPKIVAEGLDLLTAFQFSRQLHDDRSALVLRAMLDLRPDDPWRHAENPPKRLIDIMDFLRQHYGRDYKPNIREAIRHRTLLQFMALGLAVRMSGQTDLPLNSSRLCYQIDSRALEAIRAFGTRKFSRRLERFADGASRSIEL